jgi:TRAP-type C4-dicarboxylate transport system permease small subunit
MERYISIVTRLSRIADKIAGFVLVAVMLLVVGNVLLRSIFKTPILGTYEYVGFFTAIIIGLSLAYCGIQRGHIAIEFLTQRLPIKIQALLDLVLNAATLVFMGLVSYQMGQYARTILKSGSVSPTTEAPFYLFITIVAFGLFLLCLTISVRLLEDLRTVIRD